METATNPAPPAQRRTHLARLRLTDFRNYSALDVSFPPGAVVLSGPNGAGKSNLVEAIYLLGRGRSPRSRYEQDLIRFGAPHMRAEGTVQSESVTTKIAVTLRRGPTSVKSVAVNDKPIQKLSQLIGQMGVVAFSPEDLQLVRGGPEPRRAFFDAVLAHLSPTYLSELLDYHRVLKNRNAVLRQMREGRPSEGELDVWTTQLVDLGCKVVRRRLDALSRVAQAVAERHRALSGGTEELTLEYRGSYGPAPVKPETPDADLRARFEAELAMLRGAELDRTLTLSGPHRDDLLLRLNGHAARSYASQGQARTAALAVRQAEVALVASATGRFPVIVFDDVLSELDPSRQEAFSSMLRPGAQSFVTGADPARLRAAFPDSTFFTVSDGVVGEEPRDA